MIYVTGSEGFIASHLIIMLSELGFNDLVFLDKKKGRHTADLAELNKTVKAYGKPTVIFHLGASCSTSNSLAHPYADFIDNAAGTVGALELARVHKAKFIYTSSIKALKTAKDGSRTPYGLSKYVGDLYVKEYAAMYGVEYIINHPGTIYGFGQEGSAESGWLAWFIKCAKENIILPVFGNGKQVRDVLYISDYIRLLLRQMTEFEDWKNKEYEMGGGRKNSLSILEATKLLGIKEIQLLPERQGDIKKLVSKNRGLRGWKPTMGYKEGILNTLEKYK